MALKENWTVDRLPSSGSRGGGGRWRWRWRGASVSLKILHETRAFHSPGTNEWQMEGPRQCDTLMSYFAIHAESSAAAAGVGCSSSLFDASMYHLLQCTIDAMWFSSLSLSLSFLVPTWSSMQLASFLRFLPLSPNPAFAFSLASFSIAITFLVLHPRPSSLILRALVYKFTFIASKADSQDFVYCIKYPLREHTHRVSL